MNFFPPTIGIDISETSVKAASLKKSDKGFFSVVSFGREYLPAATLFQGEIKNYEALKESMKAVLENPKHNFPRTKYITASLPEEKAFLRILELPATLKENELAEALKFEIESNMPVSLEEVYYDYEVLNQKDPGQYYQVMVNAVPKKTVDSYADFFAKSGYSLIALEIESVSTKRSLFPKSSIKESVLVLDIGATQTRFMIVAEGVLRFTSSNSVAGNNFSSTLRERFPINLKEAEFMKRMVGLDKNHEKGRELLEALRPALVMLKDQILNYAGFFETHPSSHAFSESAQKISKVVLTGGGAGLWGLTDWLAEELHLNVVLGNPLVRINPNSPGRKMSTEEALAFTTSLGLAMRSFDEINS